MPLPDGLKFLHLGWWVVHLLAFALVFSYGFRKGRAEERRAQRARGAVKTPASPA